jgi:radical SAM protein with 4Fe4S-binding SPASM domain
MYEKIWEIQTNRLKGDLYNKICPTRLRLRLTLRCNLKCKFCIQRTFGLNDIKPEEELTRSRLLKLIDEAYNLGIRFVEISGNGEPLCKKDSIEIMGSIKKKLMFGELTTNGTLFSHESVRKLVDLKWDLIRFSIDGAKAETNDYLRGVKGGFEAAKKNMELFKEIKKEKNSEIPQIAINFIITSKNYKEIPGMIDLLNEVGGSILWLTPMILQTEKAKDLILNEEEKNEFNHSLRKADELAKKYSIKTNIDQFIGKDVKKQEVANNHPLCFMPWSDITIGENGQVGPCFAFYFDNMNVKDESLEGVWKSPEFSDLRNELLKGAIPSTCHDCKQWWGPEEAKQIHQVIKNARREN